MYMNGEQSQHLLSCVEGFSKARVLVIGDVMLDTYEWCSVQRISPEAPVPIATVSSESLFLGGAANVAHNIAALSGKASLMSVVGDDMESEYLRNLLIQNGIEASLVVMETERVTTVKKRVFGGTQQLLRIDRESTAPINASTYTAFLSHLTSQIDQYNVIVISDYCKGVLTDQLIEAVTALTRERGIKVLVDSKNRHLLKYKGVHLIKPNKEEAELLAGEKFALDYSNLESVGSTLTKLLETNIVITLGADGVAIFEGMRLIHKKTIAREVFDVSGAGDTVLAALATSLGSGTSLEDAVDIANHAAGYVVSKLGTAVCDLETLRESIKKEV